MTELVNPVASPVATADDRFKPSKLQPGDVIGEYRIIDGRRAFHAGVEYPFPGHKAYFNIDTYLVRRGKDDTAPPMRLEVFERGDAVGVLLFNRDTREVIVVEQFRLPTVASSKDGGMIVETVAGEVKNGKKPEQVAIDRTLDETGFRITQPELIAQYFSSPGGTSERIYLYYAEVGSNDEDPTAVKPADGIKTHRYSIETLTRKLQNKEILDPKLLIAAYHLQARLGLRLDTDEPEIDGGTDPVSYVRLKEPRITVGIKTGDVLAVRNVDIWLNPENRYMMMSRIIDKGLSASIRWGGAEKYRSLAVATDTIGNALRVAMGGRAVAEDIVETVPGALRRFGVKRLLHLPIAEADGEHQARGGLRVDTKKICPIITAALRHAHDGEHGARRFMSFLGGRPRCTSVLIPLIGAGEGGVTPHHCVPEILRGIEVFLAEHPETCLREFYLLAYWKREADVCRTELAAFAAKYNWSTNSGQHVARP